MGMAGVRQNYDNILAKQANGTYSTYGPIVLTHEIDGVTMDISQEYLPQMIKQFTGGVVPVGVCMKFVLFFLPHSSLPSLTILNDSNSNTEPYIEQSSFVYPNYEQWMSGTRSISLATPTADPSNTAEMVLDPTAASATATATGSATASGGAGQASRLALSRAAAISSGTQSGTAAKETESKKAGASRTLAGVGAVGFGAIVGGMLV